MRFTKKFLNNYSGYKIRENTASGIYVWEIVLINKHWFLFNHEIQYRIGATPGKNFARTFTPPDLFIEDLEILKNHFTPASN